LREIRTKKNRLVSFCSEGTPIAPTGERENSPLSTIGREIACFRKRAISRDREGGSLTAELIVWYIRALAAGDPEAQAPEAALIRAAKRA
jgi:hypothetical protein